LAGDFMPEYRAVYRISLEDPIEAYLAEELWSAYGLEVIDIRGVKNEFIAICASTEPTPTEVELKPTIRAFGVRRGRPGLFSRFIRKIVRVR